MPFGDDEDDNVASTENDILDQVEAITGDTFDGDDDVSTEEEGAAEEQLTPEDEKAIEPEAPKQTARSREVDPGKRDSREQQQRWIAARRHTDYNYNENGDVIDNKGEVLFARGTPARDLFAALKNEQFERSRVLTQAQQLYGQYEQQQKQLEAYSNAFKAAEQSGLKLEDQALAMQMMSVYRKDPVQGLRKMLHDFQVEGGDLSEIFEDLPKLQTEGIEARLKAMADRIEAPERQKAEQETRTNEMMKKFNEEVQTFFGENPEAETHSDTLAHIINSAAEKGQKVSLQQAWTRLMRFCIDRGLRIDVPLAQQLSDDPAPKQRQSAPKPMPGRGRSNGLAPKQSGKPSFERNNRDFVREAMEEAGFQFDS